MQFLPLVMSFRTMDKLATNNDCKEGKREGCGKGDEEMVLGEEGRRLMQHQQIVTER